MYNFCLDTSHSTLLSFYIFWVNSMTTKVGLRSALQPTSPDPTSGAIVGILLLLRSIYATTPFSYIAAEYNLIQANITINNKKNKVTL